MALKETVLKGLDCILLAHGRNECQAFTNKM